MRIITCEQVSDGHPDKICDQISDAIVTDCLAHDKGARVAIECLIKDNHLIIAGELTSTHKPDYAVAISFGDDKDYYVIEDSFFENLYKAKQVLDKVYEAVSEYNCTSPEDREYLLSTLDIEQMIEEVYQ